MRPVGYVEGHGMVAPALLTEDQWRVVEARLANDIALGESHEAVVAELRTRIIG
jgi:hypothetical protein